MFWVILRLNSPNTVRGSPNLCAKKRISFCAREKVGRQCWWNRSQEGWKLRSCVLLTVLGFWIISQNYTAYCENKRPNILVSVSVPTGVPFQKHKNIPKISAKQAETQGFLCPKISKISKMFKNSGLNTFNLVDSIDSIESIRSGQFDRVDFVKTQKAIYLGPWAC